jgi:hypothetical protein
MPAIPSLTGKPTYGVFVPFGRRRLALRRGLGTAEEAFAFASRVRAERFHDTDKVIVVREADGEIVTEPAMPESANASLQVREEE